VKRARAARSATRQIREGIASGPAPDQSVAPFAGRCQAWQARELGVKQETVSRLEQGSDMLLSALRDCVESMGGELELMAKFPDRAPVRLKTLHCACGKRRRMPEKGLPTAGRPRRRAPQTRLTDRLRSGKEAAGGMLAEARKDVNRYDTSCQHTEAGATASKNADAKWPLRCAMPAVSEPEPIEHSQPLVNEC
jgi:hypothetical protein